MCVAAHDYKVLCLGLGKGVGVAQEPCGLE